MDVVEVRGGSDGPSVLVGLNELSRGQNVQVKGKRRTRQTETTRDRSRRESVGGVADEQAENIEARLLRQSSQRVDGK